MRLTCPTPPAQPAEPSAGAALIILLVEDDPATARDTKELLAPYGCSVFHVANGERALELMEQSFPADLVILDIDLGSGMNGMTTARHIRQRHETPIIYMSGHSLQDMRSLTWTCPGDGYVEKPFESYALMQAIRKAGPEGEAVYRHFPLQHLHGTA
jgi:CheY-like chemotaxis protein